RSPLSGRPWMTGHCVRCKALPAFAGMTASRFSLKAVLLLFVTFAAHVHAVVLTGEVRSIDAQVLITPQSNSSPVVIRFFVPEGQAVKKGDVVLRIDPGQSAAMIPDLDARIEQTGAKGDKDIADLEVKALDAELALVDAEAELAIARIDAKIPKGLI